MARSVAEHQQAVVELLKPLAQKIKYDAVSRLPLQAAVGRVLAQRLTARLDLPVFDNSQMDGYAISAGVVTSAAGQETRQRFVVTGTVAAGDIPESLEPGTATAIMTGAAVPAGTVAVVPVERAQPSEFIGVGEHITVPVVEPGEFIRRRGSDLPKGQTAIEAGVRLTPAHCALAASLGMTELAVLRKPYVLVLTTGDEVVAPDGRAPEALPQGKIFDANSTLMAALLTEAGVEVELSPVLPDTPSAVKAFLSERLAGAVKGRGAGVVPAHAPEIDLIISTGGISAGAFEVVRQALGGNEGSEGTSVEFLHVAMQPGGPQAVGTISGVPFLGFPGNPVSSAVSFEMFLRPALACLLGSPAPRSIQRARLAIRMESPVGKHQVRRGIYRQESNNSGATVSEVGGASSHFLASLAQANALIQLPVGVEVVEAGQEVEVWLL